MSQAFRHQGLHALGGISKELKAQRERREAAEQARKEAEAAAERERHLFAHYVGPVTPLSTQQRVQFQPEPPTPRPLQLELDEQRVLLEAMSDEFDVSTLLDVDDQMSFRRPGIGLDVTRKLRSGHWSIQRHLDLHGLRSDEAREALGQFIRLSHRTGLRCVRVVHGKGWAHRAGCRCSRPRCSAGWCRKRSAGLCAGTPGRRRCRCTGRTAAAGQTQPVLNEKRHTSGVWIGKKRRSAYCLGILASSITLPQR